MQVQQNIPTKQYDNGKLDCKYKSCEEDEEPKKKASRRHISNPLNGLSVSDSITKKSTNSTENVFFEAGSPLDKSVKEAMESRFNFDFSDVRIHTDENAAQSAYEVNALAYTIGNDIVFGKGQYSPNTLAGIRLLSHELTHTIQRSDHIQLQEAPNVSNTFGNYSKVDDKSDIYNYLNGLNMKDLLKELIYFQEKGDLRKLIENLIFASGVHTDRLLVAMKAVELKDTITVEKFKEIFARPLASIVGHDKEHQSQADEVMNFLNNQSTITKSRGSITSLLEKDEKHDFDLVVKSPDAINWPYEPGTEAGIMKEEKYGTDEPKWLTNYEKNLNSHRDEMTGVIMDPDNLDEVIGYRLRASHGITSYVDRKGTLVFMDEVALERPVADPTDFIPSPGSVVKSATGIGSRIVAKKALKKAVVSGHKVPPSAIARMRNVAKGLFGRMWRKALVEPPNFVRRFTDKAIEHSFEKHAPRMFGIGQDLLRKSTHLNVWKEYIKLASVSKKVFPTSTNGRQVVGHLARIKDKWFAVYFDLETGQFASAWMPEGEQLSTILKLVKGVE